MLPISIRPADKRKCFHAPGTFYGYLMSLIHRPSYPKEYSNVVFCSLGYLQNHTRGIYPAYYPTKNFCKFCRTFIPVPGTSVRSVRPCHNTRGTGTAFVYLPGTSVRSGRPCHNTRNFWKFCRTFIPVPETSVSFVRPVPQ